MVRGRVGAVQRRTDVALYTLHRNLKRSAPLISGLIVVLQQATPDVAVADASSMLLQVEGAGRRVRSIHWDLPVLCRTQQGRMAVRHDAIVE